MHMLVPTSHQHGCSIVDPFTAATALCPVGLSKTGVHISKSVLVSGTYLAAVLSNKTRPIFHLLSDNEDDAAGDMLNTELQRSATSGSQTTSESITSFGSSHNIDSTSSKDNVRRYHALMELLSTEVGYLMDLRALVNVRDSRGSLSSGW